MVTQQGWGFLLTSFTRLGIWREWIEQLLCLYKYAMSGGIIRYGHNWAAQQTVFMYMGQLCYSRAGIKGSPNHRYCRVWNQQKLETFTLVWKWIFEVFKMVPLFTIRQMCTSVSKGCICVKNHKLRFLHFLKVKIYIALRFPTLRTRTPPGGYQGNIASPSHIKTKWQNANFKYKTGFCTHLSQNMKTV